MRVPEHQHQSLAGTVGVLFMVVAIIGFAGFVGLDDRLDALEDAAAATAELYDDEGLLPLEDGDTVAEFVWVTPELGSFTVTYEQEGHYVVRCHTGPITNLKWEDFTAILELDCPQD